MEDTSSNEKREHLGVYRRILKIDRLIASNKFPSTKEIIDSLMNDGEGKFSISTIKRDIQRMIEDLNAPIEYSKKEEGWYYSEHAYRLPAVFTTEGELFAAELTKMMVKNTFAGTSVISDAQSVLGNLTSTVENPLKYAEATPNDWVKNRILILENNSEPISSDVWQTLTASIKSNREIVFLYKALSDSKFKQRKARPYQLLFSNGEWSLWCFDTERKATRLFKLSRMKSVELTHSFFRYSEDCSYLRKNNGIFGAYTTDQEYEFKFHLWGASAEIVKPRTWGKNQDIRELNDGYNGIELTFTGNQYHAIFNWIMGFGSECIPVAPENLVNDWKKEIQKLYDYIK